MAVEKRSARPVLMRDYLGQFQKRSAATIIGVSSVSALCIAIAVGVLYITLWSALFWVVFIISAIIISAANIWLFWRLSQPFRDLVTEVVIVGGETANMSPPNPNERRYAEDGFKEILQTVYELATKKDNLIVEARTDTDIVREGLDQTICGVVILDTNQSIIYHNRKAPIHIAPTGKKSLDLQFFAGDSIYDWLVECEKKAVHADHTWTRIADKPAGEHGRRIYDIIASYQKNKAAETVITFFDRTDMYAPEEDDLDFVSFAAHELRGPITVIRGYLDVLEGELRDTLQNDQADLLQRLIVSSNRLSSYVNNILNASRYDRRHFKIYPSEEKVSTIYQAIREDMQLRAVSQNRLLTIDIPDTLPTVAADKNSIGEVMSNLIDNAIKYSNEGGQVIVRARTISKFVEISIIDRGIGMPSSVLPNLFHKFYRSHRSRETVAGTGIGLYISKAIVESHGGTIEVRSTEREGSTFSFTLPIYDTVADKITANSKGNELLIERGGWIRNHSMYRG